MDDEMKTMMAEGGIKDDGMDRDPVSGNEVPPGSLAKEVRDDVDAKLSEGEYVVPADVVRFFGVSYFEKLRDKAKAGLEKMDAGGRIGGEPVPAGDDLPFTDEELMSIEDGPVGMAEGGAVGASTFNPAYFQPGFSFGMAPTTGTGGTTEAKTYINDAGEVRSILFVNGQPTTPIPEGFYEDTPENRQRVSESAAANVTPVTERDRDRDRSVRVTPTGSRDGDSEFGGFMSEEAKQKLRDDPLGFGADALKGDEFFDALRVGSLGALAGPVGMVAGAGVGGGFELENIARAQAALLVAKDQGLEDTEGYRTLQKQIEDDLDELSGAGKLLNTLGFGTGEKYFESLSQTPQAIPTDGTPVTTSSGGVTYKTTSSKDDNNKVTTKSVAQGSTAPTTSVRPTARPSNLGSSSSSSSSGSSSKGLYESVTGKKFKDTALGKALGLGD